MAILKSLVDTYPSLQTVQATPPQRLDDGPKQGKTVLREKRPNFPKAKTMCEQWAQLPQCDASKRKELKQRDPRREREVPPTHGPPSWQKHRPKSNEKLRDSAKTIQ